MMHHWPPGMGPENYYGTDLHRADYALLANRARELATLSWPVDTTEEESNERADQEDAAWSRRHEAGSANRVRLGRAPLMTLARRAR